MFYDFAAGDAKPPFSRGHFVQSRVTATRTTHWYTRSLLSLKSDFSRVKSQLWPLDTENDFSRETQGPDLNETVSPATNRHNHSHLL